MSDKKLVTITLALSDWEKIETAAEGGYLNLDDARGAEAALLKLAGCLADAKVGV